MSNRVLAWACLIAAAVNALVYLRTGQPGELGLFVFTAAMAVVNFWCADRGKAS